MATRAQQTARVCHTCTVSQYVYRGPRMNHGMKIIVRHILYIDTIMTRTTYTRLAARYATLTVSIWCINNIRSASTLVYSIIIQVLYRDLLLTVSEEYLIILNSNMRK